MRVAQAAGRARILFLGVVGLLWLGAILARLIDLQIVHHGELAARAQRQQQRTLEVTPKRGVIYDRNRHELAVSVSVDSVFAVPGEVTEYAVEIMATANLFRRGHRICLEITSLDLPTGVAGATNAEYVPYHICSSKTVVHRIYHDAERPSHLLLPVIPPNE